MDGFSRLSDTLQYQAASGTAMPAVSVCALLRAIVRCIFHPLRGLTLVVLKRYWHSKEVSYTTLHAACPFVVSFSNPQLFGSSFMVHRVVCLVLDSPQDNRVYMGSPELPTRQQWTTDYSGY